MLDQKTAEEDEGFNHAVFTPHEVARLLKIDIATVRLWSELGLLHAITSSGNGSGFRWSEVLTFLPKKNSSRYTLRRIKHKPASGILRSKERERLAEMNVQAITELTKQSVEKLSHPDSSTLAKT